MSVGAMFAIGAASGDDRVVAEYQLGVNVGDIAQNDGSRAAGTGVGGVGSHESKSVDPAVGTPVIGDDQRH